VKFSINTKEFVRVLSSIQGIIDKTGQNQLSYVYLQVVDDNLLLNATNYQLTLVDRLEATVEEEGVICVKAHRLLQVMKTLYGPITTLSLSRRSMRLNISCGKANFNIKECNPPDDFPPYNPPKSDISVSLSNKDLRRMLIETVFSIMKPERPEINGAHVEVIDKENGSFLRMVTTDGNRLSISEAPFTGEVDRSVIDQKLLPQRALQELLSLTTSYNEQDWTITFGQRKACFSIEKLEFSFSLNDGKFPDYNKICKNLSTDKKVILEKKAFTSILKRVSVFHSKNAPSVMFSLSSNGLEVSIKNPDMGDFKEDIPVDYDGDDLAISFRFSFFQELLAALEAEYVQLDLNSSMSPCLVTVPKRDDCQFIIMPMRHNS
jgi:DNA polymerase-3 subunit beta